MEARFSRDAVRALACRTLIGLACLTLTASQTRAGAYRTANFTVAAPTPQLAKEIGDAAEHWRRELALEWLGKELPRWAKPCPIKARVAPNLGAGGATSFVFDRGQVFGWQMEIQGSRERLLDSVVPHEVTHTIFASHFRRPLPRWADEGACTTVEHHSEISKQERMLIEFLKTSRGIPFSAMFAMKDYPQDVLPLYAQGHSLAKYLIARRGKREFLKFLSDGMTDENWPRAIRKHYGYDHLLALQNSWLSWVRNGRPEIQPDRDILLASANNAVPRRTPKTDRADPDSDMLAQSTPPQSVAQTGSVYARRVNQSPEAPAAHESTQQDAHALPATSLASPSTPTPTSPGTPLTPATPTPPAMPTPPTTPTTPTLTPTEPTSPGDTPWPGQTAGAPGGSIYDASANRPLRR